MATRLAEANLTTLLLEAGGPSYGLTGGAAIPELRPPWLVSTNLSRVDVPGLYKSIFGDPAGLICDSSLINAYGGCTIGGGSAINAGLFFEPPDRDWDRDYPPGWQARDMRGATERVRARVPATDTPSMDGEHYLQSGYVAARRWLVGGLGFREVRLNAAKDEAGDVFGHPVFASANGQRGGPVTTYLRDAMRLPNFHLQSAARALRVERRGRTATGVWVLVDGTERLVPLAPGGRVVLSAGALSSPALLMFSGIGPPAELARLSAAGKLGNLTRDDWIPNPAVGARLFDNPNTFLELAGPALTAYTQSYLAPLPRDAALFLDRRAGPYTSASQTAVFFASAAQPDGRRVGFQGTFDSSGHGEYTSNTTITLNIYGTTNLASRGRVELDAAFVPGPSADVYYSAPGDARAIARFIARLLARLPRDLAVLNVRRNATAADVERYITTPSAYARGAVNHWCGSCAVGACVDARGRVRGMGNLWVVDAGLVEGGGRNPMAAVMAVAERGSELILRSGRR